MLSFLAICAVFAICGLALGYFSIRFKVVGEPLVEKINALLPQTQCAQCNYPGCRPYAEAVAQGLADINQCPPGGEAGVKALADLLGKDVKPLDAARGPGPPRRVAIIDESLCVGCALCLQACPVDAILGAAKYMHTVIAADCTGCALCLPPCPVDCIGLVPVAATVADWRWPKPAQKC